MPQSRDRNNTQLNTSFDFVNSTGNLLSGLLHQSSPVGVDVWLIPAVHFVLVGIGLLLLDEKLFVPGIDQ